MSASDKRGKLYLGREYDLKKGKVTERPRPTSKNRRQPSRTWRGNWRIRRLSGRSRSPSSTTAGPTRWRRLRSSRSSPTAPT